MTVAAPSTAERCRQLLRRGRGELTLSPRERSLLGPELAGLDRQLERLERRRPRLAVFGRVGVGKSSLLNARLGEPHFATDVAHGCTRRQEQRAWPRPVAGLAGVDLVDTPGIDEIAAAARARLARRVALGADLVLLVLDADLSRVELEAIDTLLACGKPLLLVLNRSDCWPAAERPALLASIRRRLPAGARHLEPIAVVLCDFSEDRRDHLAGAAPLGPVVHEDRLAGLQDIALEGGIRDVLDGVAAHEGFFPRLPAGYGRGCR
jgi:GTP-binding protein EngB required for normal cell division